MPRLAILAREFKHWNADMFTHWTAISQPKRTQKQWPTFSEHLIYNLHIVVNICLNFNKCLKLPYVTYNLRNHFKCHLEARK